MTNIAGTIAFVVLTNWTTAHVEKAECHTPNCKEQHFDTHYQVGSVVTNTVLNMAWKGTQREFVLDSTEPTWVTRFGKVAVQLPTNIPPLLVGYETNKNFEESLKVPSRLVPIGSNVPPPYIRKPKK